MYCKRDTDSAHCGAGPGDVLISRCVATSKPSPRVSWRDAWNIHAATWRRLACDLLQSQISPGVLLLERKGNATGAQEKRDEVTDLTLLRRREKPMLRTIGKTVGGALAMLCLVSTLAVA